MKIKKIGDIADYKNKTVGNFTTKQALFIALSIAAGAAIFMLVKTFLPVFPSLMVSLLMAVPIAFCGFLELGGLPMTAVISRAIKIYTGGGNYKYEMEGSELFESEIKNRKADKE